MSTETADTHAGETPTDAGEDFVPFMGKFFLESLTLAALLALLAVVVTIPYLEPMTQLELFSTGFIGSAVAAGILLALLD